VDSNESSVRLGDASAAEGGAGVTDARTASATRPEPEVERKAHGACLARHASGTEGRAHRAKGGTTKIGLPDGVAFRP
jgi:hypothetical protein